MHYFEWVSVSTDFVRKFKNKTAGHLPVVWASFCAASIWLASVCPGPKWACTLWGKALTLGEMSPPMSASATPRLFPLSHVGGSFAYCSSAMCCCLSREKSVLSLKSALLPQRILRGYQPHTKSKHAFLHQARWRSSQFVWPSLAWKWFALFLGYTPSSV